MLVLECPCLDKVRELLTPRHVNEALLGLYGTQKHMTPAMVHKWCYSWYELESILRFVGFEKISRCVPLFHKPHRDMRFEAWK